MTMFQTAKNEQAYLKAALFGEQGSGKTFTASAIAIGLCTQTGDKRPVYAIDTEGGFSYRVGQFKENGVELRRASVRSFTDVLAAMDEAEKNGSVLILDSITHVWEEIQTAFKLANGKKRISLPDWGIVKAQWAQLPNRFLNGKIHSIICGRSADQFENHENDNGKMESVKIGTRMGAEKNFAYEAGLVFEMERVALTELTRGKRNFVNRAYCLKDRYDLIDGQHFDNPTYENIKPHIDSLNLGGEHSQIAERSSALLFDKDSEENFYEKKKKIEILKEEIFGELTSHWPGRTAEETKAKSDICYEIFKTRSWAALDEKEPMVLFDGLNELKKRIEAMKTKTKEVLANATKKEGK